MEEVSSRFSKEAGSEEILILEGECEGPSVGDVSEETIAGQWNDDADMYTPSTQRTTQCNQPKTNNQQTKTERAKNIPDASLCKGEWLFVGSFVRRDLFAIANLDKAVSVAIDRRDFGAADKWCASFASLGFYDDDDDDFRRLLCNPARPTARRSMKRTRTQFDSSSLSSSSDGEREGTDISRW